MWAVVYMDVCMVVYMVYINMRGGACVRGCMICAHVCMCGCIHVCIHGVVSVLLVSVKVE